MWGQCNICVYRGTTLDPQGFSHKCQLCSPFTLNLKPKPSCSLGDTVGPACFSAALHLFRQCVQPLNFLRPQHVTDQIISVSRAGFMRESTLVIWTVPSGRQMFKCPNNVIICPSFSLHRKGEAELQRPEKRIWESGQSETLIQRNTGICWWTKAAGNGGDFRQYFSKRRCISSHWRGRLS